MFDFEFEYYPPKELCKEREELPQESLNLGFLRLSFDPERESTILHHDTRALLFIYWEISHVHNFGAFIIDPEEMNNTFVRIVDDLNSLSCDDHKRKIYFEEVLHHKVNMRRVKVFPCSKEKELRKLYFDEVETSLQKLNSLNESEAIATLKSIRCYVMKLQAQQLYYWSYFYKVEGALCGSNAPLLASCLDLNKQFAMIMTFSKACLSFLGETKSGKFIHLLDIPWYSVRCIAKEGKVFSFQIQAKNLNGKVELMTFSIYSLLCDYLYSMSAYLLGIQAEEFDTIDLFPDEEMNKITSTTDLLCRNNSTGRTLYYLSPSSSFTCQTQVVKCGLFADGGFSENKFYIPQVYDLMKVYVRNVKCIPAGPGMYIGDRPTYVSCFCRELELTNVLSSETQLKARNLSNTNLRRANVTIQHHVESCETLQAHLDKIRDIFKPTESVLKNITVHTFWKGPLNVFMTKYAIAEDLKDYVAQAFNLKKSSLQIFGIFVCTNECPLDYSHCICIDSALLPDC